MSVENYPSSTSQPYLVGTTFKYESTEPTTLNGNGDVPILLDDAGDQVFINIPSGIYAVNTNLTISPSINNYTIGSISVSVNTYDDEDALLVAGICVQVPMYQINFLAGPNTQYNADYNNIVSFSKPARLSVSCIFDNVGEDVVMTATSLYATYMGPCVVDNYL